MTVSIKTFFDQDTFSFTHLVSDPATGMAAVIDPVLNYDPAAVSISNSSAENLLEEIKQNKEFLFIKSEYKIVKIKLADIKYIESMREYVRIHLVNAKPIMTLSSMKKIEQALPTDLSAQSDSEKGKTTERW